jgi:hypothetical protein
MKYFEGIFIILVSIYSLTYYGYPQTSASQQKSIISTKTVVLRYEKQTDTLRIPIADDRYPALKNSLSYKNIFDGDDLAEVIKKYESCGCGVTSSDYEVTFESKDIISIILYFQTMSAYPDNSQKLLTFNINTGETYPVSNEINSKGLNWIFINYKNTLKKRIHEGNEHENTEDYKALKTAIDSLKRDELFNMYIFTKAGILFSMEKILPHVTQAVEPDRDWVIPYDKLKPYKAPGAIIFK